ncbi:LuxR C-terminal-related transcriptional regulator [Paenibacillus doosanensis]|uniref:non-specific serine/threonine protein kinase n=1 Tax=Paenibacillus konkukensis TaxID=2020716 RepID=A0ABY4RMF1_9BACL|nr:MULTISPECIES: LuxR C-terminal-related transcriptional regulator [Paenibacillus]MCS7462577.1 LuxR C-terminal-related transcriptional regulator [Paenibacillus doosanensis]UQZ83125.1 Serine/threonine-protein kinase PknB [Paenibacillus konkukensis]
MLRATGYDIRQVIFEDEAIAVCHASSVENRLDVLLKIVKEGPRAVIENAKVINEYEVAGNLSFAGVLKPLALFREGNRLVMASEWVYGMTLKHFAMAGPVPLDNFLTIAIGIAEALEQLHQKNIVHMNIRPETIVVVPGTLRVCLTGLGHSIQIAEERCETRTVPLMEGSPPYMAPERTGQLDGWIDPSTDLYSLGVTLYEVLAGRLPFEANDPLEWAHAHVAKPPIPLGGSSLSAIPVILERIVFKLLEKSVADRYRSAAGLRADLERCLRQYQQTGGIGLFALGQLESAATTGAEPSGPVTAEGRRADQEEKRPGSKGSYAQVLEMEAIVRVSQAFTEEKDSLKLMSRIMTIIMNVSGAHKGVFVKAAKEALYAVLMLDPDKSAAARTGYTPLDESGDVSPHVVRSAAINRMPVIWNDAKDGLGHTLPDPYITRHRPKSVLGLPVMIQGDLQGVLYLENKYAPGVFSADRLPLLQMLASQLGYVHTLTQYFEPSSAAAPSEYGAEAVPSLTSRELDVLQCLSAGLSNKEIAVRLVMSAGTVKVHVRNVFDKLGVNNRVKAVSAAAKLNLLNSPHSSKRSNG